MRAVFLFFIRLAILSSIFVIIFPFYAANIMHPFTGFEVDYWLDHIGKSSLILIIIYLITGFHVFLEVHVK